MSELIIGDIDKRQLHLRFSVPLTFRRYTDEGFVTDWFSLLNPRRWWGTVFRRYSWLCHVSYRPNCTHRCYCPDGYWFDVNLHIAGLVFQVFWSRYWGDVPCHCDRVLAELSEEVGRDDSRTSSRDS